MPLQDDYQVSLDAFQGPLDLLLFLIRRAEVDIHRIPIARLTDQYLAFLKQIDHVDIDLAGEFLVMAATLIEIKSRTLMPAESRSGDGDAADTGIEDLGVDPRSELVQQLLHYQRYRIAADDLDHRREVFSQRFPVQSGAVEPLEESAGRVDVDLEDAHVLDLSEAYERIMASVDLTRVGDHRVEMDDTPTQLHQDDLLDRLRRAPDRRIDLHEAFDGRQRLERIGLFLAMLELVRQRQVLVRQDRATARITLDLNADPLGDEPAVESAVATEVKPPGPLGVAAVSRLVETGHEEEEDDDGDDELD